MRDLGTGAQPRSAGVASERFTLAQVAPRGADDVLAYYSANPINAVRWLFYGVQPT